ncbi:hypothetical protein, partial [Pseudomonas aeruginosa]|uniref:hypothetical protein n=1 Tax=Pseudomonas aeruginosa TaxID=287 RepID=UPI0022B61487
EAELMDESRISKLRNASAEAKKETTGKRSGWAVTAVEAKCFVAVFQPGAGCEQHGGLSVANTYVLSAAG